MAAVFCQLGAVFLGFTNSTETINASSLLPVITGYNESRTLHKGDNVSLLCEVPNSCLPSPEVVFACGSRYSHKRSRGENVTSLEIQIDEIEASDDGLTCVCKVACKLPETMYNNARISLETSFVLSVQGVMDKGDDRKWLIAIILGAGVALVAVLLVSVWCWIEGCYTKARHKRRPDDSNCNHTGEGTAADVPIPSERPSGVYASPASAERDSGNRHGQGGHPHRHTPGGALALVDESPEHTRTAERLRTGEGAPAKIAEPLRAEEREAAKTAEPLRAEERAPAKTAEHLRTGEGAPAKTAEQLRAEERVPAKTAEPLRAGERDAAKTAEPLRAGERDAAKTAEPLRAGERDAAKIAEPLRAGERDAAKIAETLRAGERDAAKTAEPLRPWEPFLPKTPESLRTGEGYRDRDLTGTSQSGTAACRGEVRRAGSGESAEHAHVYENENQIHTASQAAVKSVAAIAAVPRGKSGVRPNTEDADSHYARFVERDEDIAGGDDRTADDAVKMVSAATSEPTRPQLAYPTSAPPSSSSKSERCNAYDNVIVPRGSNAEDPNLEDDRTNPGAKEELSDISDDEDAGDDDLDDGYLKPTTTLQTAQTLSENFPTNRHQNEKRQKLQRGSKHGTNYLHPIFVPSAVTSTSTIHVPFCTDRSVLLSKPNAVTSMTRTAESARTEGGLKAAVLLNQYPLPSWAKRNSGEERYFTPVRRSGDMPGLGKIPHFVYTGGPVSEGKVKAGNTIAASGVSWMTREL